MIVYKATTPSGKLYIGVTKNSLKRRISQHLSSAKRGSDCPFHKSIRKYGQEIKWEVIDTAHNWESLLFLEINYIKAFREHHILYNMTDGGEGTLGLKCPEYRKAIISLQHRGRKDSLDTGSRRAIARGAKRFSVFSKESNNLVGEWLSQHQCSRDLGLKREHIRRCLKKTRKSTGGYIFQYKSEAA